MCVCVSVNHCCRVAAVVCVAVAVLVAAVVALGVLVCALVVLDVVQAVWGTPGERCDPTTSSLATYVNIMVNPAMNHPYVDGLCQLLVVNLEKI